MHQEQQEEAGRCRCRLNDSAAAHQRSEQGRYLAASSTKAYRYVKQPQSPRAVCRAPSLHRAILDCWIVVCCLLFVLLLLPLLACWVMLFIICSKWWCIMAKSILMSYSLLSVVCGFEFAKECRHPDTTNGNCSEIDCPLFTVGLQKINANLSTFNCVVTDESIQTRVRKLLCQED